MGSPSRRRPSWPAPSQIRAALKQAYDDRQQRWVRELARDPVDWTCLLGLHLQITELETMVKTMMEGW